MANNIYQELSQPLVVVILLFCTLFIVAMAVNAHNRLNKNSSYFQISGNSVKSVLHNSGTYGEYLTYSLLEKLEGEKRLLTNLYLVGENGKSTEVDLVMIHPTGIYVFESKNYSGWIYGNDKDKYWTQCFSNKQKQRFFNPVWQNAAHISAMSLALGPGYEKRFVSFIVFSQRCQLKKITLSKPEIVVAKRNYLLGYVKNQIKDRTPCFTTTEMDEMQEVLLKFAKADDETKERHVESVTERKNPQRN